MWRGIRWSFEHQITPTNGLKSIYRQNMLRHMETELSSGAVLLIPQVKCTIKFMKFSLSALLRTQQTSEMVDGNYHGTRLDHNTIQRIFTHACQQHNWRISPIKNVMCPPAIYRSADTMESFFCHFYYFIRFRHTNMNENVYILRLRITD